jgi:hypothetical protein
VPEWGSLRAVGPAGSTIDVFRVDPKASFVAVQKKLKVRACACVCVCVCLTPLPAFLLPSLSHLNPFLTSTLISLQVLKVTARAARFRSAQEAHTSMNL